MGKVHIRKEGRACRITLTRPEVHNAIDLEMTLGIEAALLAWMEDPNVAVVLIDGQGDRAFCAGGDIVSLFREGRNDPLAFAQSFWTNEYRLNARIHSFPKPYVAMMDRIVMGGGAGLSVHGSHRIVTERTQFAMPECSIGMIPDVGGTFFLGSMPGHCGEYAGLTGCRLDGADCIYGGLADWFVHSSALPALIGRLAETGDPATIREFARIPPASSLERHRYDVDAAFCQPTLEAIEHSLRDDHSAFARETLAAMSRGSPLALRYALSAIRDARNRQSLDAALDNEFRFGCYSVSSGEFLEGIRAALIDRDNAPDWPSANLRAYPRTVSDLDFLIGADRAPAPHSN